MEPRIVFLETDSVGVPFGRPSSPHVWIEHALSAAAEVPERLAGAHIAIVNKVRIDAELLDRLPDLKMIAVAATGTDNVDLAACDARGIVVSNVQGYANTAVPEHVMALMLALSRRLIDYHNDVRAGRWAETTNFCFFDYPMVDLQGATLGLVGSGSLGGGVARRAEAFGMQVLWSERPGVTQVRQGRQAFADVLRAADVLSLHCPLTDETRHMIDAEALRAMKRSALLINTARGALIDEVALADALRTGEIAGAAIDVLTTEPPARNHPLLAADVPNLVVTPHVAWATQSAMRAVADQVVENIDAFLAGTPRRQVRSTLLTYSRDENTAAARLFAICDAAIVEPNHGRQFPCMAAAKAMPVRENKKTCVRFDR